MNWSELENIYFSSGKSISSAKALEILWPLLTEARRQRISSVVQSRIQNVAVILESLYDRGNISAVMRTAEALGIIEIHSIETQDKFKVANRVVQGADKWLEMFRWTSTLQCVSSLKKEGRSIYVTCLDPSALPLKAIDFTKPCAVVMGNEKDGVSQQMLELADEKVFIPMKGFVQSFNISVAAALSLYEATRGFEGGDLSPHQQELLKVQYALRTLDSGRDICERSLGIS